MVYENGTNICSDSDGEHDLNEQSKIFGVLMYGINNCTKGLDGGCLISISASDVCINSNTLNEQTCVAGNQKIETINCPSGCSGGKCL